MNALVARGLLRTVGLKYELTDQGWALHRSPPASDAANGNGGAQPPADDAEHLAWLEEARQYTATLVAQGDLVPCFPTAAPYVDTDGDQVCLGPDGVTWLVLPDGRRRSYFDGRFWEARDGRVLFVLTNKFGQEIGPNERILGDALPCRGDSQPAQAQAHPAQQAAPRAAGWYQTPDGVRRYWDGVAGWEVDVHGRAVRLPPAGTYPMPREAMTWDGLCWVGP